MTPHHNYNYTTLITLHHNYSFTTLQLQVQPHYTTLHPAVVGEVTTATIATISKNINPITFQSISGFALPSMHHSNSPLPKWPIFETSVTALCGTTGINILYSKLYGKSTKCLQTDLRTGSHFLHIRNVAQQVLLSLLVDSTFFGLTHVRCMFHEF